MIIHIYIYIDDIEIFILSEIAAIDGDYKLSIMTPLGNTIQENDSESKELVLEAKTTYLNNDITTNVSFYWGVKDPLVTSSSDNYNSKLGTGYRYIESNNGSQLKITANELIATENIYQCVAIYETDIILKETISLYNNKNKINITIESDQGTHFQFNEGNPTLTCLINGKSSEYLEEYSDSVISFVWSRMDDENGLIILDESESQLLQAKQDELEQCKNNAETGGLSDAGRSSMEVYSYYDARILQVKNVIYPAGVNGPKLQCRLINAKNYVTYSCSVYCSDSYIGFGSITLQNAKNIINDSYYVTIDNGNQVFQYTESGVSPAKKNKDPIEVLPLTAIFHSPQGAEVTPESIKWIVPTNNTLIDAPSLQLSTNEVTGEKYFKGQTYPLAIKDTYNYNYNNNQITAVVIHTDGKEYRQSTNLLFTKVGEIGTNGTDTVVKINELITPKENEVLTLVKEGINQSEHWNDINSTGANISNSVLETKL